MDNQNQPCAATEACDTVAAKASNCVQDHPDAAVIVSAAAGMLVGVALSTLIAGPSQPKSRFSAYGDRLHGYGDQASSMAGSLRGSIEDAISNGFRSLQGVVKS
ncbi:hypothetical protein Mal64_14990 [Pseudobythopirellula maris]|uniref:YtxH-like protein n=1 Tax=Pseudobythopirellula maris TaxID=2527991 RepID=A0A5C5ZV31_9BACT|nr:hypothetical protein [Pseudobythopirellula maris]TWT91100.1 hypothetical protein Mal64_14990 [Pseudobythopirellula maris]